MITGAMGDLGTGAVILALAMGASLIIIIGRDQEKLKELTELDGKRVRSICSSATSSTEEFNVQLLKKAMNGEGADLLLDFMGGTSNVEPLLTSIRALKYRGKAIFVGNIDNSIPLQYTEIMANEIELRGCFMFPPHSYQQLIRLIQADLLDLTLIDTLTFPLEQINQAIQLAKTKTSKTLLKWIILQPNLS